MQKITRRQFLKKTAQGSSTLALSSLISFTNSSCGSQTPPNLVFIFPDQMRGQAIGFLGEESVITPNLDQFAKESAVFTEAVSNYPVCSPYRGMLMTGQYPHTNGVTINCNSRSALFKVELKKDSICWSDILKSKSLDHVKLYILFNDINKIHIQNLQEKLEKIKIDSRLSILPVENKTFEDIYTNIVE